MPEPVQRFSDWSPEFGVLVALVEQLDRVANILIAANGGKPGAPFRWPRPQSSVDRFQANRKLDQHRSLVDRLTPKR